MRRISLLLSLNLILLLSPLSGQTRSEFKAIFVEAESYFLFEEYKECLPSYLQLLKVFPDNANYKYRIGICYLNMPGEKEKSIKYLQEAAQNINPKYREGSFRETGAPLDAYFYLGNAYRINNKLDKAITTYQYFKENLNEKIYDVNVVDHQIETCKHAQKLENTPVFLSYQNLGGEINTNRSEYNPVISGDEQSIIFTRALPFYDAVFFSRKVNGEWTNPINLTPELYVDRDFYSSALSFDGKTLYLYKNDNYDGNIYISHLDGDKWSTVEKLNNHINTKYWESHAAPSKNEDTLYFTSNRKGTLGGLDIYYSVKDTLGGWGPPVNLGPNINTPYNEETPFITPDGQTLYFSSYGHYNMGGYDIFYSNKFENGEWSKPVNMGYPINTTDDDLFYTPVGKGYFAYYSQFAESGYGGRDIFKLEIFSEEHPRKFLVHGIVSLGLVPLKVEEIVTIHIIESSQKDTILAVRPSSDGQYSFTTKAGEYDLNFTGKGFMPFSRHLSLVTSQPDSVLIAETLMELSDVSAELALMDTIIDVQSDTIDIHLKVEAGSLLTVEKLTDTIVTSSDQFLTQDELFNYRYIPDEGDNNLRFTLTDPYGNTTTRDLYFKVPVVVAAKTSKEPETLPEFTVSDETITFRDQLSKYATGDLKNTIDATDLEAERIGSSTEFVSFLKAEASNNEYSPADVDALLFLIASRNNFDKSGFIQSLEKNSSLELNSKLDSINLYSADLSSIDMVIAYLLDMVDKGLITREELEEAVAGMAISEDPRLKTMRDYLNSIASGKLKKVLDNLEPEKEHIYSTYGLIDFLRNNAAELGYTEEELALLLARLAGNGDPDVNNFLKRLIEASDGNLKTMLEDLNLKSLRIKTISDLIKYLLQNKGDKFTSEDLMNALIEMISQTDIDMNKVKELIMAERQVEKGGAGKYVLVAGLLAGILIFLFLYKKRKKPDNKNQP